MTIQLNMDPRSLQKFVLVSLLNLLAASLLGVMLRYAFIEQPIFNYAFLLHAHSHVAALGWAYQMITVLMVYFFIPEFDFRYKALFWVTQIAVTGMLFSFPFQGYGSISISFSVLHILCSYYFIYLLWKNGKFKNKTEKTLIRTALIFLFVSTIGIWLLPPALILAGKESPLYHLVIQFYLHFQFQGWFIFAVLGLLYRFTKASNIDSMNESKSINYMLLLSISTLLGFSLILNNVYPSLLLKVANAISAFIPVLVILYFIRNFYKYKINFSVLLPPFSNKIILFAIGCLLLKYLFHLITIFPEMTVASVQIRNYNIAFLHMVMLGFVSVTLFLIPGHLILPAKNQRIFQSGLILFLIVSTITVGMIFLQGLFSQLQFGIIPGYFHFMFYSSILFPVSILMIITGNLFSTYLTKKDVKNHNIERKNE